MFLFFRAPTNKELSLDCCDLSGWLRREDILKISCKIRHGTKTNFKFNIFNLEHDLKPCNRFHVLLNGYESRDDIWVST